MSVNRRIRLNLRNFGNLPAVMLSQYDEGYNLVFEIFDGASAAGDLSGYTATLKGVRSDALSYSFTGTISNNVLTFEIDTTMTGVAGKGTAEIVLTASGVVFATFNMPVFVEKAAVPDGSIDADVTRAEEVAEQIQEIVDTAAEQTTAQAEQIVANLEADVSQIKEDLNYTYYSTQQMLFAFTVGKAVNASNGGISDNPKNAATVNAYRMPKDRCVITVKDGYKIVAIASYARSTVVTGYTLESSAVLTGSFDYEFDHYKWYRFSVMATDNSVLAGVPNDVITCDVKTVDINQSVYTIKSGGSILEGVKAAYAGGYRRIVVEAGTYDIISEYESYYGATYFSEYATSYNGRVNEQWDYGIWLDDINISFSAGAKVTANYTGNNANVTSYFSAFACGNDVTIDGLVLDCTNLRYGIHPDFWDGRDINRLTIRNCDLHNYRENDTTGNNNSAIGAGLPMHGEWLIENCVFRSDTSNRVLRIHNNVESGAKSLVVVKNCYIDGSGHIEINSYGASTEKSIAIVSGCSWINPAVSVLDAPQSYTTENITLLLTDNVTRGNAPYVSYTTEQALTDGQKETARNNISAANASVEDAIMSDPQPSVEKYLDYSVSPLVVASAVTVKDGKAMNSSGALANVSGSMVYEFAVNEGDSFEVTGRLGNYSVVLWDGTTKAKIYLIADIGAEITSSGEGTYNSGAKSFTNWNLVIPEYDENTFAYHIDKVSITAASYGTTAGLNTTPICEKNVTVREQIKSKDLQTSIDNLSESVVYQSTPVTNFPTYLKNVIGYKPAGSFSKPYICLSTDDGREGLIHQTIEMVVNEAHIPITFCIHSHSDIFYASKRKKYTLAEVASAIDGAITNYGCELALHDNKLWADKDASHKTPYTEKTLVEFVVSEQEFFADPYEIDTETSLGVSWLLKSASAPEHCTDPIVSAIMGGTFGMLRSGDTNLGLIKNIYEYKCIGARSNLYCLTCKNFNSGMYNTLQNCKDAVDYAVANNLILPIFWHEAIMADSTTESDTNEHISDIQISDLLLPMIEYAKEKGVEFVTLSQIPNLI